MEGSQRMEYLSDEDELSTALAVEGKLAFKHSDEDHTSSRSGSESSDNEQEPLSPTESAAEGDDITMMSLASLQEDLEKGKAAKEQVGKLQMPLRSVHTKAQHFVFLAMFDGALETRIRLQKLLVVCNQLPQPGTVSGFQKDGGQQLEDALKESESVKHRI